MNKAFHKVKQPETKTNLFLPWKKIQFQIKNPTAIKKILANPSRILNSQFSQIRNPTKVFRKFPVPPNHFQRNMNFFRILAITVTLELEKPKNLEILIWQ